MPNKNKEPGSSKVEDDPKAFEGKSEQGQEGDTAIDQRPETGGGQIRFWASAGDDFDDDCHRLANHECRHCREDEIESCECELFARENANKQRA